MGTQLIIDTDPGVDDAFAITLAALGTDVDLLGVTTVFGNVPLAATTRNAQRVLALCGRADVPVAAGAERPLVYPHPHRARYAHGVDGLSGRAEALPEPARELAQVDAVNLLVTLLEAAQEPVTIAPIGPLTNIAALLAAHPGVRSKIDRLVIMGGGLSLGNVTPAAEFNIWSDPEAARRVLVEDEVPAVLVPMDLTVRCAVDADWLGTLRASGPIGAALDALTPDYRDYYRKALGWDGTVLHDAVAVAEAISPGILETERLPIEVDCTPGPSRGATVVDRRRIEVAERAETSSVVDVAVDTDLDGLRGFVLGRLTRGAGDRP
ncbi:nucleoside hydrolase [Amycolatopsis cihanbeyliensis]|uniref:Pyrimidine-specific ribonucleoside hydrolase n=1 Tax=Amycolatopsis cihanbeyliensis TaxID=1128664 RepID=A0A542CUH4_AMYCI|nr:nucleoside hydrolase [Amycolatopsis cihanbeyliensis]TQI94476.1 pyrimidine-specific ribonucleoside hydrolase [Amycolatopsis cihanbeyliensis]